MARPTKGSQKAVKVVTFLPPNVIEAIDERIPSFGGNRSAIIRLVLVNWAEEGWVLKKGNI